jgi:hypothetical protein
MRAAGKVSSTVSAIFENSEPQCVTWQDRMDSASWYHAHTRTATTAGQRLRKHAVRCDRLHRQGSLNPPPTCGGQSHARLRFVTGKPDHPSIDYLVLVPACRSVPLTRLTAHTLCNSCEIEPVSVQTLNHLLRLCSAGVAAGQHYPFVSSRQAKIFAARVG